MPYNDIIKRIEKAIKSFGKGIPAAEQALYDELLREVAKLDTVWDRIKPTVANLKRINAIKNKLYRLILTDEYKEQVKEYAKAFNDVTKLQNEYWRSIEADFKPRPLLKEIRKSAIGDVVKNLTESGVVAGAQAAIDRILRTNITTGGSVKDLMKQLRQEVVSDGIISRTAKTIVQTSLNQYSAQYTNIVSSDLGFEWYRYSNSLIDTSREFCLSMRQENEWFHISMVPALLKAEGLYYTDNEGVRRKVPINPKTNLPNGFIKGTDASNFFINRAGWNCGHQLRPVSEGLVPIDVRNKIMARDDYKRWAKLNS